MEYDQTSCSNKLNNLMCSSEGNLNKEINYYIKKGQVELTTWPFNWKIYF